MKAVGLSSCRSVVFSLVIALAFLVLTTPLHAATPAKAPAAKTGKASDKFLVVAAYEVLGTQSKIARILREIRAAFVAHTGLGAYTASEVDSLYGQYGVTRLGKCSAKVPCLIKQSSVVKAKHALYVNVGGFGGKLIFEFLHIDLTNKKKLTRFNKNFAGIAGLKKGLPKIMATLFPLFAKIQVTGKPSGAQVFFNENLRGNVPTKALPVAAKKNIQVKVTHPGYKPKKMTLQVPAQSLKLVKVNLTPIPVKTATPVYQTWWFWTIVGAGTVAVGTGVVLGITSGSASNPQIRLPL